MLIPTLLCESDSMDSKNDQKTNREMAVLRKQMNENIGKTMREVTKSETIQSVSNKKIEQTTSRIRMPKCTNDEDGELAASDTDNQENEMHDNSFRPSDTNEHRTPIQPICIQNFDLDDSPICAFSIPFGIWNEICLSWMKLAIFV